VIIYGNLDCEAQWANKPLPQVVRARLAMMSTLMRALSPRQECELLTIADVTVSRIVDHPELPTLRILRADQGTSGKLEQIAAIAWAGTNGARQQSVDETQNDNTETPWSPAIRSPLAASAVCKAVNDRRLTIEARLHAGVPLAGVAVINSVADLQNHLTKGGASLGNGEWICKAPWTAAGRDRVRGTGFDENAIRGVAKLLRQCGGSVVFEPWLQRTMDLGVCAAVHNGKVSQRPPHQLLCNPHGGFAGIEIKTPTMTTTQRDLLTETVEKTGELLHHKGYQGPFTVDSFLYSSSGKTEQQIAPLCEINARLSFGWIALALTHRFGRSVLRVGAAKDLPSSALPLVLPTNDDSFCVWLQ
jgi:hypothetical protein